MSEKKPWGRAALLLALLGPFFFASYGFATWYTSRLAEVPSLVFAWERQIPLWPWTIVPYWSVDLFYVISFFICATRAELYTHAKRLFAAQLISVTCFLLFPLRFTFERPQMDGIFGAMFAALMEFDKPFNQAPSLHISLLLILWLRFSAHLGFWGRFLLHGWFTLIGLSVLTTWQHHFIDVPTGIAAGALCIALFPEVPRQRAFFRQGDAARFRLAAYYAVGATLLGTAAFWAGKEQAVLLWLFWPATSLALVSLAYLLGRPETLGKQDDGQEGGHLVWPLATVLLPYLVAVVVNSRWWTRRSPQASEVAAGVSLGRAPRGKDLEAAGFRSLVDCAAELPVQPGAAAYQSVPMLDLLVPEPEQLAAAVAAIEAQQAQRPTLVSCALGFSRSAMAVAAWLLATGRAARVDEAVAQILAARPQVVLTAAHHAALERYLAGLKAAAR